MKGSSFLSLIFYKNFNFLKGFRGFNRIKSEEGKDQRLIEGEKMKVKILAACAAVCTCLAGSGVSALAHGHGYGHHSGFYTNTPCVHHDENCDGLCDGCGLGLCYGYIDQDGNGICDHCQQSWNTGSYNQGWFSQHSWGHCVR